MTFMPFSAFYSHTSSFKVNIERNQWYDFGTGEYGDIIDLVCALQHCTMYEAIELLIGSKQIVHQDFSFGGERKTSNHRIEYSSFVYYDFHRS